MFRLLLRTRQGTVVVVSTEVGRWIALYIYIQKYEAKKDMFNRVSVSFHHETRAFEVYCTLEVLGISC